MYRMLQRNISRRAVLKGGVAVGAMAAPFVRPSARAAGSVVHIGASLPLTGPYEKVSKISRDGYEFFTKVYGGKMNVAGQLRDIKLTIYDDENNASRTAQLTEKLVSDDKVDLILGTYGTDTILAQGSILHKYGRVVLQAGAASGRVDEEIGGHTAFTCINKTSTYGVGAVNVLSTIEPRPTTLAVITMDDPVYHEIGQGVKDRCAQLGIKLVSEVVLPMNTQDFRPAALKLKGAGNIDIIYNTGWDLVCVKLAQELATLGINPKAFVGGHLTTSPIVKQSLGSKMNGVIGTSVWLPEFKYSDDKFTSCQDFSEKFKAAYGYIPDYHVADTYVLPWIYQDILKDADPADPFNPDKLRKALAAYNNDKTIWGPVSFDKRGRIKREEAAAIQWFDSQYKVVAPKELEEAKLVYPKPAW